mmetsp:Transcript_14403/g.36467  ORF Transcript_14403/g.36467 Transcript_14403/m.36467 type:complete len:212 (+) Transcript_14403:191-826(+)
MTHSFGAPTGAQRRGGARRGPLAGSSWPSHRARPWRRAAALGGERALLAKKCARRSTRVPRARRVSPPGRGRPRLASDVAAGGGSGHADAGRDIRLYVPVVLPRVAAAGTRTDGAAPHSRPGAGHSCALAALLSARSQRRPAGLQARHVPPAARGRRRGRRGHGRQVHGGASAVRRTVHCRWSSVQHRPGPPRLRVGAPPARRGRAVARGQ